MNKNPEVLAPVGSPDSLFAAVRCGADAVYFGHKNFSARRNAGNFSNDEMAEAVKYCHKNRVKVYLTLNIAIKDKELKDALNVAETAYLCGVDGLILSDLGLSYIIHNKYPDIELHASTQMSVNSPAALKILKELGFCRVVPAREMSKKELIALCEEAKNLDMEVEVFVHGALCMCLSGQCLLSSVLGGRSGNRGLCAGPCRLPFSAQGGTGFDLSLKDLSLLEHIGELKEMGVSSLKIEGRMKRPEYIATAVTATRNMVDYGVIPKNISSLLTNVFSRSGFTDGYFTNNLGKEMFGTRSKEDAEKSKDVYSEIHKLYRCEKQKIPIYVEAEIKKDRKIRLSLSSEGFSAEEYGNVPSLAQNAPVTEENVKNLVSKFGNTPFYLEKCKILLEEGLFVSSGELNRLRRNVTEKILNKFSELPKRRISEFSVSLNSHAVKKRRVLGEFLYLSQIPDNYDFLDLIILPPDECLKNFSFSVPVAVSMPRFIFDEKKLIEKLSVLYKKGITTAVCGNLSSLKIAKDLNFKIIADKGLNILNSYSALVTKKLEAEKIILSPELSFSNAERIKTSAEIGIFAYGKLPLMCFKNCPVKNGKGCKECKGNGFLRDRTNTLFPVRCRDGYSEMFNSMPLFLADKLKPSGNFDFILLSFTDETKKECNKILSVYKNYLPADFDFTRGLYYKEVL